METKFQTSFIPRKPLVPNSSQPTVSHHGSSHSFITLLAFVIFGVSVASGVVVLGWQKLENVNIEKNKTQLEVNKKQFGSDIDFLKRFNSKINMTKGLIDSHVSPATLFSIISDLTVEKVRYKSLDYSVIDGVINVKVEGEASSFETLASQSDVFGQSKLIENQSMSDLKLNEQGKVTFSFSADIPWSSVAYKNKFNTTQETNE